MRQAERVPGVGLLGRDYPAPRPLIGVRRSGEHDGNHETVPIHHRRPHVEIEAAVGLIAGLNQRRLQLIEAGDPTQVQVDGGQSSETVVAAGR